jgi:lipopolysaccharide heptosyltransferase II
MLDFSIYLLYRAVAAIIALLPLRVVFYAGRVCGGGAWLFAAKYRKLATRNVEIAFGDEKSSAEIRRLVRRHFSNLGANLLSAIKINAMPLEKTAELFDVEGMEELDAELRHGRSVVLALSHIGNWELFTRMSPLRLSHAPLATIYQRLGNRFLDEHVSAQRACFGVEPLDRSEGFQKAIQLLRRGGLLGVLSDQHAGDHGLWTPFFGRLASTSPLAGLLSKRTGAALFAAAIYTRGPARWRIAFTPRLDAPGESVQALTAKANATIEQQIRHAPEDWFWVHNRWKTPNPNFLLSNYKRGVYVPTGDDARSLKPFRIVIRASNWLGDSVMSMPAVRAIKAGRPDAQITIAAPAKIAAVWRLLPEVSEVIALPNRSLFRAARAIRNAAPFDVAILFPNSLRSAMEVWLAGVPRRVGYRGHHRRWLLHRLRRRRQAEPVRRGPPEHQAHRYLALACAVGAADVAAHGVTFPSRAEMAAWPNGPVRLGLCAGAEYGPAKRWLPQRFAEVAANIADELKTQWSLFGTPKDAEIGAEIETALGDRCVNRIGKTNIDELIAELRECRLLLTNDTGTMHLASLLGVPVVAVFGSTEPRLTGPLGARSKVIRHQVECSPCFLRECPIDFRCMHAVTADEVTAAVLAMLRDKTATA